MAGLHAGLIEFNCNDCDAATKKSYGCEEPAEEIVWQVIDTEMMDFYTCPRIFAALVLEWYEQYSYDLQMSTALQYEKQSPRYLEAWKIYNHYLIKFQNEVMKLKNKLPFGKD